MGVEFQGKLPLSFARDPADLPNSAARRETAADEEAWKSPVSIPQLQRTHPTQLLNVSTHYIAGAALR